MNGSAALIKKFGAVEKKRFINWEGSEEDYVLCELILAQTIAQKEPETLKIPIAASRGDF